MAYSLSILLLLCLGMIFIVFKHVVSWLRIYIIYVPNVVIVSAILFFIAGPIYTIQVMATILFCSVILGLVSVIMLSFFGQHVPPTANDI